MEPGLSRCIDAAGQKWKLSEDGSSLYLIKGRVWVNGGVLFREGKSGIVASLDVL